MAHLLEVQQISKRFGAVEALRGVDLALDRGEVLAIVGDNGAGKSTLIKIISGVYRQDGGQMLLEDVARAFATPKDARKAAIETIYQDLALADDLNVGANIFLGREPVRRLFGFIPTVDRVAIRRETDALLQRIESRIPDVETQVRDLSGGQRQAVAIARALYWRAKVVIMDEPTAALAVMERENVTALARTLAQEGVGVIYIGHNLIEVLEVADRVAVMYRGEVVYQCPAKETSQNELIKYMTGFVETEERAVLGQTSTNRDQTTSIGGNQ